MTFDDKILLAAKLCAESCQMTSHELMQAACEEVLRDVFQSPSSDKDDRPGEADLRYLMLDNPSIKEHLTEPALLDPVRMVAGRSYLLTPGQRAALRELTGMTPTKTVTITDVRTWDQVEFMVGGSKQLFHYLRGFTLRSDEHIDPRRKHVLSKYTIQRANIFFDLARVKDQEIADQRLRPGIVLGQLHKGVYTVQTAGMDPVAAITTLNLTEGDRVLFKYDPEVDKWKITKCLEPKEVSEGKGPRKQPKLEDLTALLDDLKDI